MSDWITLLYGRNDHNIVNQPQFNKTLQYIYIYLKKTWAIYFSSFKSSINSNTTNASIQTAKDTVIDGNK